MAQWLRGQLRRFTGDDIPAYDAGPEVDYDDPTSIWGKDDWTGSDGDVFKKLIARRILDNPTYKERIDSGSGKKRDNGIVHVGRIGTFLNIEGNRGNCACCGRFSNIVSGCMHCIGNGFGPPYTPVGEFVDSLARQHGWEDRPDLGEYIWKNFGPDYRGGDLLTLTQDNKPVFEHPQNGFVCIRDGEELKRVPFRLRREPFSGSEMVDVTFSRDDIPVSQIPSDEFLTVREDVVKAAFDEIDRHSIYLGNRFSREEMEVIAWCRGDPTPWDYPVRVAARSMIDRTATRDRFIRAGLSDEDIHAAARIAMEKGVPLDDLRHVLPGLIT